MKYTTVIWDFNGTIVQDVDLSIRTINHLLEARSIPVIDSIEKYHSLFCFPVREYYQRVGFDFEKESYEKLAHEWIAQYLSEEHTMYLTDGFLETCAYFHTLGLRQVILSSSERNMLLRETNMLGITHFFDMILGIDNIYAGGKIEMAKKHLGESCTSSIMIGDTLHDADTASAIGADCILYTGGHASKKTLSGSSLPLIDHLLELKRLIQ